MSLEKILYTGETIVTGGREGRAVSSDGMLDVQLSKPVELGGEGGIGANPEQLFAAGYSACFLSALQLAAGKAKIEFPKATSITGRVAMGMGPTGYGLEVELRICMPGLSYEQAETLAEHAHQICPYSNAIRGNADVALVIVD
ncbi:organic hydroperoxide resistance protein [Pseudomonas sp. NA-150]|uniref:organic hydroperoxide resistance protein n=1 Tax=Pseudomonas sp. NA-150 TaxID=3367525 RepID=UPI0037C827AD